MKSTDPLALRERQLRLAKQERATAERLEQLRDQLDIITNALARPTRPAARMYADAGLSNLGNIIALARHRPRRRP
jgi:hypothetical protein